MWSYRVSRLILAALVVLWASATAAQDRLALVIGVDTYQTATIPDLQRARNDAIAVGAALSEIGFSVTQLLDPTRLEMTRALIELEGRIRDGDEVAFFFAGHGVEVAGENFLLPADMPVVLAGQQGLVQAHGVSVDFVRARIQEGGARVRFLILDACRENPFPSRSGLRSGGLAEVRNSAEGEFILYSAGAQQVALDGLSVEDPNPNSVFTRTLLPLLHEPGLPLHEMARQVRRDVRNLAATVGAYQRPAIHDDIDTNYALVPVAQEEPALEELWPLPPPPPQAQSDPACDIARPDWERALASGDIAQFRAFAAAHPDCTLYAEPAATMIELLSAQAAAVESSEELERILAARDAQIDRLGAELNAALARAALAERARAEREAAEAARQAEALAAQSEVAAEEALAELTERALEAFRPGARPNDLDLVATIDPTMSVHETAMLGQDRRIICSDALQCAAWEPPITSLELPIFDDPEEAFHALFFGRAISRYHLELPDRVQPSWGSQAEIPIRQIGTGDNLAAALDDAGLAYDLPEGNAITCRIGGAQDCAGDLLRLSEILMDHYQRIETRIRRLRTPNIRVGVISGTELFVVSFDRYFAFAQLLDTDRVLLGELRHLDAGQLWVFEVFHGLWRDGRLLLTVSSSVPDATGVIVETDVNLRSVNWMAPAAISGPNFIYREGRLYYAGYWDPANYLYEVDADTGEVTGGMPLSVPASRSLRLVGDHLLVESYAAAEVLEFQ